MKWFQIKERSAGKKRLLLSWYIYKLLGKRLVKVIAFCVAFLTFITNKDLRSYTNKYFKILKKKYQNKTIILNFQKITNF